MRRLTLDDWFRVDFTRWIEEEIRAGRVYVDEPLPAEPPTPVQDAHYMTGEELKRRWQDR